MTGRAGRPHLDDRQRRDWLRLIRSENVGPITFRLLLNRYGSAETALEALPALSARGGLRRKVRVASLEDVDAEIERIAQLGAALVCPGETGYPPLLAETEDAPPLLTVQGHAPAAHRPCVAIVGSRNASAAGLQVARRLATDLAAAGLTVVSGLARGIDSAAHEASLDTGTLAVLAGGHAEVYPERNRPLAAKLRERGLLISEMHVSHSPRAPDFPRRNRIISGSSHGVIIVEAAKRSGSLITARMAAEQNRDVFAVPGSVLDPRADGTNDLIRKGATLVTCANHVIEALQPQIDQPPHGQNPPMAFDDPPGPDAEIPDDPELAVRLLQLMSAAPIDFDTLCREAAVSSGPAAAAILELELAGQVQRHPGNRLSRRAQGRDLS